MGEYIVKLFECVKKGYNDYVDLIGVNKQQKKLETVTDDTPLLYFLSGIAVYIANSINYVRFVYRYHVESILSSTPNCTWIYTIKCHADEVVYLIMHVFQNPVESAHGICYRILILIPPLMFNMRCIMKSKPPAIEQFDLSIWHNHGTNNI